MIIETGNYSASHGSYCVSRNLHILQRSKKGVSAEETPSYRKKQLFQLAKEKYWHQKTGLTLELKPLA